MNKNFTKTVVTIIGFSILFSQVANAARFGRGRSVGSQPRYSNTQNYNRSYNQQQFNQNQSQYNNSQQQYQQRRGMGAGTAAVLGAAAGAAGGYMIGKSMSNSTNSTTPANESLGLQQQTEQQSDTQKSNMPWGIIVVLGILLLIGLAFFRRKQMPQLTPTNNKFDIPSINQDTNNTIHKQPAAEILGSTQPQNKLMPDGIESEYFLRQAKGMFLHIQSMNTPENIDEIKKYMTPELYQQTKEDIINNAFVADFSQLECKLMQSNNDQYGKIEASVMFNGMVSEEPQQPPVKFSEIWHFTKQSKDAKWIVSGVEQVTQA